MKRKIKVRIASAATKNAADDKSHTIKAEPSPCVKCSPDVRMSCCGCEKGIEWEKSHKRVPEEDDVKEPIVSQSELSPCAKCNPDVRAACCGCKEGIEWERTHKGSTK